MEITHPYRKRDFTSSTALTFNNDWATKAELILHSRVKSNDKTVQELSLK